MNDAILEEFKKVSVAALSDAMKGRNGMNARMKPLDPAMKVCGRAVTVTVPPGDNMLVLKAMAMGNPGGVLVVDASGDVTRSFAGDFVIAASRAAGFSGVVGWGAVRDSQSIVDSGYPVFCCGVTMACSKKIGGGALNVPVCCAGVTVHPGDIVAGDRDGVVVIPRADEERLLEAAKAKIEKDDRRAGKYLASREKILEYITSVAPEK